MEKTNSGFRLSTGREIRANESILGLSFDNDHNCLRATHGFDGSVIEDEQDFADGAKHRADGFTAAERLEIGQYMVSLWNKWAMQ